MTKEALVEMYAPETGYLPSKYERVLRKEAGLIGALGAGAKGVGSAFTKMVGKGTASKGGNFGLKQMSGGGGLKATAFGKSMNISNKALGTTAAGVAGAGALGTGAVLGRATAPNR